MLKTDCFQLGHITKKHSFKGEVVFHLDTDDPEKYLELESVLLNINGELIPFFIEQTWMLNNNKMRVRLEDVNTEKAALELVNSELFLPLSFLPPLTGKKFYFHEVIGFKAIDINQGELGTIKNVLDETMQALFLIENADKEILVPAIDDFIDKIDRKEKIMYLHTPEGLIDLYL